MAKKTILFTGFPGFLGARLIPRLLEIYADCEIVALVEPKMVEKAKEAADERGFGERVKVESGDITDSNLGLSVARYRELTDSTVSVFHLAAIYNLAVPEDVAHKINVVGTENIVAFCKACKRLKRHNYISTAYVAGDRHGRVKEAELEMGQEFKNHYESTKHYAEVAVRESMGEVPTTIYRPGIVVGDSQSGETQKFDGPYYLLRLISSLESLKMPMFRPGLMSAKFNMVPCDYIVEAIAVGSTLKKAEGETFHLVNPKPTSARKLYRLFAKSYAPKRPIVPVPRQVGDVALSIGFVRNMLKGTPKESLLYLEHKVDYDTSRADKILAKAGVKCPPPEAYVDNIVRFFKENEEDESLIPHAN